MTRRAWPDIRGWRLGETLMFFASPLTVAALKSQADFMEAGVTAVIIVTVVTPFWLQIRLSQLAARLCNCSWREQIIVTPLSTRKYLHDRFQREIRPILWTIVATVAALLFTPSGEDATGVAIFAALLTLWAGLVHAFGIRWSMRHFKALCSRKEESLSMSWNFAAYALFSWLPLILLGPILMALLWWVLLFFIVPFMRSIDRAFDEAAHAYEALDLDNPSR